MSYFLAQYPEIKSHLEKMLLQAETKEAQTKIKKITTLMQELCEQAERDEKDSVYQRKQKQMYDDLLNGTYGEEPKKFFQQTHSSYHRAQTIILQYLVMRKEYHKNNNDFENVLHAIFENEIQFYFDEVKHILFLILIPDKTQTNAEIISVCRFLFADMLMLVEIRWNCYPVILNRTYYTVAGEQEQLCGTII